MSPKSGSMCYVHIFCGWSKRPKPNEGRRACIRSAWLCFVVSNSPSHATRALHDEAIDRSASGSEIPVAVIGELPPIFVLTSVVRPPNQCCCAMAACGNGFLQDHSQSPRRTEISFRVLSNYV